MNINSIYGMLFLIVSLSLHAQTGVFTKDPLQSFHIDAAKDNAGIPPSAPQILNDVVVTSEGKIGVGLLDPKTKVDIRSADQKGIIDWEQTLRPRLRPRQVPYDTVPEISSNILMEQPGIIFR